MKTNSRRPSKNNAKDSMGSWFWLKYYWKSALSLTTAAVAYTIVVLNQPTNHFSSQFNSPTASPMPPPKVEASKRALGQEQIQQDTSASRSLLVEDAKAFIDTSVMTSKIERAPASKLTEQRPAKALNKTATKTVTRAATGSH